MDEQPFSAAEQHQIRTAILHKYCEVARSADGLFSYPTGRKGALALGYGPALVDNLPDEALDSFCGVGNPFTVSQIAEGSEVLDIGCGGGFDLLVARELVGDNGRVCGIDLSEEMIAKAQSLINSFGDECISVAHVASEQIPHDDKSFDCVISNGVVNLSPAKLELFKEIYRVLKPGGVLQFADVCLIQGAEPDQASSPEDWAQ